MHAVGSGDVVSSLSGHYFRKDAEKLFRIMQSLRQLSMRLVMPGGVGAMVWDGPTGKVQIPLPSEGMSSRRGESRALKYVTESRGDVDEDSDSVASSRYSQSQY